MLHSAAYTAAAERLLSSLPSNAWTHRSISSFVPYVQPIVNKSPSCLSIIAASVTHTATPRNQVQQKNQRMVKYIMYLKDPWYERLIVGRMIELRTHLNYYYNRSLIG